MAYVGTIKIGSRKTPLVAIFDTGSSFNWFCKATCMSCRQAGIEKFFDCPASQTCDETIYRNVKEKFGIGEIKGDLVRDTIFVTDLQANNQDFLVITEMDGLKRFPADGLIGLGSRSLSGGLDTLMDNLYQ